MKHFLLTILITIVICSCANKREQNSGSADSVYKDSLLDHPNSSNVYIKIINHSGYDTKLLTLKHEKGRQIINNLTNNSGTSVLIKSGGENSISLMAVLANDDTLKSMEYYTEGGYRLVATINVDSIDVKYLSQLEYR